VETADLIEQIATQGVVLVDAAARAGWDAAVPPCPGWTVRDLVVHLGGVHRWATRIVAEALPDAAAAGGDSVGSGPAEDELLDWYRAANSGLVDALRAAPADLDCWAFLPADSPLQFWARRQAHETAIHRADAQAASGAVGAFPPALATDGIAEMLTGFARRRRAYARPGSSLLLVPSDGPVWRIEFGPERLAATQLNGDADATVAGTSSALYLWLWHRPARVEITGDTGVVEQYDAIRVNWS
jgi:uncharacterized protein (TIGR03083 family)